MDKECGTVRKTRFHKQGYIQVVVVHKEKKEEETSFIK